MRIRVVILLGLLLSGAAQGKDSSATRHGVTIDLKGFPQSTPREALASILKAIEQKRFDYLLAHLSDPEWVDARVDLYAGGFQELVREAAERLDPPTVKQLQRLLQEGDLETLDASAVVRHMGVPNHVVRLLRVDQHWYLQNTRRP